MDNCIRQTLGLHKRKRTGYKRKNFKNLSFSFELLSERLVGILLLVYVKKRELHPFCRDEMKAKVGVGLFGHVGNKGGVGIRFKIWDSTLCFVSTHLAAHKKNVQGRNQDFAKIFQHLKFTTKDDDLHLLDHE